MPDLVAAAVVYLVGLYFLGLAAAAAFAPPLAARFLLGHAGTARAHYVELLIRAAAGAGFLLHGPSMRFGHLFVVFGWVLVGTTAALLLVPWRWHRAFARRTVPQALRYLPLIAGVSLLLGGFVIFAAAAGAGR